MRTSRVQDVENISREFDVYPVVPNKLGKVMECEAKKVMLGICLEMINIEWGQIDPEGHRRVTNPAHNNAAGLKVGSDQMRFSSSQKTGIH